MQCTVCLKQLPDDARFCSNCGTPVGDALHPRLVRHFFTAVEAGELETVEHMLEQEPRLANARTDDLDKHTALHLIAKSHHENAVEIARALLDYGADVNARSGGLATPLNRALRSGTRAMCSELLNRDSRWIRLRQDEDWYLLFDHVHNRDLAMVEFLVYHASVNPNVAPSGNRHWHEYAEEQAKKGQGRIDKIFEERTGEDWREIQRQTDEWDEIRAYFKSQRESPGHLLAGNRAIDAESLREGGTA